MAMPLPYRCRPRNSTLPTIDPIVTPPTTQVTGVTPVQTPVQPQPVTEPQPVTQPQPQPQPVTQPQPQPVTQPQPQPVTQPQPQPVTQPQQHYPQPSGNWGYPSSGCGGGGYYNNYQYGSDYWS